MLLIGCYAGVTSQGLICSQASDCGQMAVDVAEDTCLGRRSVHDVPCSAGAVLCLLTGAAGMK